MQKLNIDNELRDLIPPLTKDEFSALEESIKAEGCRDPIITWQGTIVDGHNRYKICQKHDIPFRAVGKDFDSKEDVIVWMIENQLGRRNVSDVDRMLLAQRKAEIFRQRGIERMKRTSDSPEEDAPVNTQKSVAEIAGVSTGKLAQFEQIQKELAEDPEELEETLNSIRSGDLTVGKAYTDLKRKKKSENDEKKRAENAEKVKELDSPLEAQGLFQTIVVDPPWDWGDEGDVNQMGRAKPNYHTMPIDEIADLPINEIADTNCHLYLWVTNRSLPKAFDLINEWGFRYITCLTWVKPSFGMGNYFRGSTEQVLFAVKGSQMLKRKDVGTHFEAPRGKEHSEKPVEFYSLVESCSYGPYIDVFGRKERDGWSVWGADIERLE